MADQFGPHSPKGGPRLDEIQGLGRPNLGRRFVEVEDRGAGDGPRVPSAGPGPAVVQVARRGRVGGKGSGPKGGRPGLGAPWLALGISRATYWRRKKGGEL
jgi:hypothetical protein